MTKMFKPSMHRFATGRIGSPDNSVEMRSANIVAIDIASGVHTCGEISELVAGAAIVQCQSKIHRSDKHTNIR